MPREIECDKSGAHSGVPGHRCFEAPYIQRGNTGPATTRPPFRPAIWRAPWPGILDNACCGKNCTRWRGGRTRRTRPHGPEGGRAAVENSLEGFSSMRTEYMSPFREEIAFVGAEHIGHFEPMLGHRSGGMLPAARTRSSAPSISSGLLVERTVASAT